MLDAIAVHRSNCEDNWRCEHRKVGGMPVATAGEAELIEMMVHDVAANRAGRLAAPVTMLSSNGHALSLYAQNAEFASAIDGSSIVHADGKSIVTLSRLLPGPDIAERTATTDFIHSAAAAASGIGASFFLLGADEEVNGGAVVKLQNLYPRLQIAGARHGYFDAADEARIVESINASGADVLWVGMGKPREQAFVARNRHRLNCAWIITCGGCFDFLAGAYTRAPRWMQDTGLEWLHRAFTGPRYLLGRYLTTNIHTLWLAVRHARDV